MQPVVIPDTFPADVSSVYGFRQFGKNPTRYVSASFLGTLGIGGLPIWPPTAGHRRRLKFAPHTPHMCSMKRCINNEAI